MAYIGASPTTSAFVTDTFNGNGSTVAFTMSVAPANTTSIIVAVSGVLQDPSTYSVSGTTLTFSAAPPSGTGNISVRFLGIPASGVTSTAYRTQTEFTATAGQTTFSVPSYTVGYIDVYRNGVLLGSADFTATSGTTVVLTNPASSGDLVETVSFYVSSVLNAIPAQNNAVIDSYILSMAGSKLTGTQVIPKATLPTGSVLQVVSTAKTDTFSESVVSAGTSSDVTGLTASITPSATSSKILVNFTVSISVSGSPQVGYVKLYRGGSILSGAIGDTAGNRTRMSASSEIVSGVDIKTICFAFLDSPSSTSSLTYSVRLSHSSGATRTVYVNRSDADSNTSDYARAASTITVMESAA